MNKKIDIKKFYSEYTFVFSFLVLIVIATAINHSFLSWTNLSTLLLQSSIKGIIALGMTLVIISGQIDLSVGSQSALIAGLGVVVLNKTESAFIMLAFCMIFGAFLGTINGVITTKGKIAPFIVTLATMSAYRSIIVQLGQGGPFNINMSILMSFRKIASGKTLGVPNLAIIFILVTICMVILTKHTKFGRYVYAVGSNEHATFLTGVNVIRVKTLCFTLVGFLTGISSFLLASRLTSITAANVGMSFELDAIAAVAIGGTSMSGGRGKIIGTFLGAIMLQMIEGILIAARIPPFLSGLVKGVIIILAVIFQSRKNTD
ncbi:ABC transporter permease [Cetobacterium somerae]|uniref:ABC transporter permease n=1 Tax=Cetobacterium somerae TaxID=188913 RepID=UPI00211E629F|nr:ABC transporter permease [Cetobacterium somerae]MCQ9627175.1 ABC transporter permease [Cetobacterium somerae]